MRLRKGYPVRIKKDVDAYTITTPGWAGVATSDEDEDGYVDVAGPGISISVQVQAHHLEAYNPYVEGSYVKWTTKLSGEFTSIYCKVKSGVLRGRRVNFEGPYIKEGYKVYRNLSLSEVPLNEISSMSDFEIRWLEYNLDRGVTTPISMAEFAAIEAVDDTSGDVKDFKTEEVEAKSSLTSFPANGWCRNATEFLSEYLYKKYDCAKVPPGKEGLAWNSTSYWSISSTSSKEEYSMEVLAPFIAKSLLKFKEGDLVYCDDIGYVDTIDSVDDLAFTRDDELVYYLKSSELWVKEETLKLQEPVEEEQVTPLLGKGSFVLITKGGGHTIPVGTKCMIIGVESATYMPYLVVPIDMLHKGMDAWLSQWIKHDELRLLTGYARVNTLGRVIEIAKQTESAYLQNILVEAKYIPEYPDLDDNETEEAPPALKEEPPTVHGIPSRIVRPIPMPHLIEEVSKKDKLVVPLTPLKSRVIKISK